MKALDWREFIVSDEKILGGKPILKGTRLSVAFVLELLAAGWETTALFENYPNLNEERLRAVLAYAAQTFRDQNFFVLPPRHAA